MCIYVYVYTVSSMQTALCCIAYAGCCCCMTNTCLGRKQQHLHGNAIKVTTGNEDASIPY